MMVSAGRRLPPSQGMMVETLRDDLDAHRGSPDKVAARRLAGSTLKPFLYQLALQQRYLTAAALLDDSPLDMATAGGLYSPQNYSRDFKGLVSVRSALGASFECKQ